MMYRTVQELGISWESIVAFVLYGKRAGEEAFACWIFLLAAFSSFLFRPYFDLPDLLFECAILLGTI
jgi:hypothetical protein